MQERREGERARTITQDVKNLAVLSVPFFFSPSQFSHLCSSTEYRAGKGQRTDETMQAGGGVGFCFIGEVRFFPCLSALLSDISNALDNLPHPPPLSLLISRGAPAPAQRLSDRHRARGGQANTDMF